MFALRDAIYLIELGFYVPIIPAIVCIILIHGGQKPYTWRPIIIPLLLLASLRIAGSSIGLTAMNPDKASLLTTSTLLDTIGLAPVMCVLIGVLMRANAPLYQGLPFFAFLPLQLTTIVATAMTAYGGRDLYTSQSHADKDVKLMRAGAILFIIIFSVYVVLSIVTMMKAREKGHKTERTAAVCALLAVPFMCVRLAFSAGSLFSGSDSVLNPMSSDDTSLWLHLFMVIIMEYIVTLSTTTVALTARRIVSIGGEIDELLSDEDDWRANGQAKKWKGKEKAVISDSESHMEGVMECPRLSFGGQMDSHFEGGQMDSHRPASADSQSDSHRPSFIV